MEDVSTLYRRKQIRRYRLRFCIFGVLFEASIGVIPQRLTFDRFRGKQDVSAWDPFGRNETFYSRVKVERSPKQARAIPDAGL